MTCVTYLKRYWLFLLIRWAAFASIAFAIAYSAKADLRELWPIIVVATGVLNLGWIFVA